MGIAIHNRPRTWAKKLTFASLSKHVRVEVEVVPVGLHGEELWCGGESGANMALMAAFHPLQFETSEMWIKQQHMLLTSLEDMFACYVFSDPEMYCFC